MTYLLENVCNKLELLKSMLYDMLMIWEGIWYSVFTKYRYSEGGRGFPVLEQNRERLKLFIERKTFGEFLASVALLIIISIKKTRCVKFIKSLISFLLLFVKIQKRMITFKSVTNIWFSCNIAQYNIYNDTNKVYSVTSVIMSQTLYYIIYGYAK